MELRHCNLIRGSFKRRSALLAFGIGSFVETASGATFGSRFLAERVRLLSPLSHRCGGGEALLYASFWSFWRHRPEGAAACRDGRKRKDPPLVGVKNAELFEVMADTTLLLRTGFMYYASRSAWISLSRLRKKPGWECDFLQQPYG